MKITIDTYRFIKQVVKSQEFELPDETSYYFQTGVRRSIRIVPVWSTWKKERGEDEIIFQYHITCVYLSFKNKIESFTVSATSGITDLYNSKDENVIQALLLGHLDERNKEDFEQDLQTAIDNLNRFEL